MSTVKLHYKNIAATASTYIGEPGSIFFDPATSQLRVGDGATPGGNAVTLDIGLATHDDSVEILANLFSIEGSGFVSNSDSLKQISTRVSNVVTNLAIANSSINSMASGTSLSAVQSAITTAVNNATTVLATSTNLAVAQSGITATNSTLASNLSVPTSSLAQASNLATLQNTANNINANTNMITGVGFVPGTDDLHQISQAIAQLQTGINAIKTHLGI